MPVISKRFKFVFIHIPKTGGTSVTTALEPYLTPEERAISDFKKTPHLTKSQILKEYPDVDETFRFFTVVRHPLNALYSFYCYTRKTSHAFSRASKNMSFDQFALSICGENGKGGDPKILNIRFLPLLWHGQHFYIQDDHNISKAKNIPTTKILRFEDLKNEFEAFCKDVLFVREGLSSHPVQLPHVNATSEITLRPENVPCSANTRDIVFLRFRKDYELFGYEK